MPLSTIIQLYHEYLENKTEILKNLIVARVQRFYMSVVFPGTPVSSTNKTDRHDINEILLTVSLNTNKTGHHFLRYN
jgi:hypothetical protein